MGNMGCRVEAESRGDEGLARKGESGVLWKMTDADS